MAERTLSNPLRVAMLIYPGIASIDATGPLECFGLANYISGNILYDIITVSPDGASVTAAGGWVTMQPTHSFATADHIHTVLVSGGPTAASAAGDIDIRNWLQRQAHVARRVGSICNASEILAATGLLDGHRVATHWLYADRLSRNHTSVTVDAAAVFIESEKIWTSAGMTTGMDMALAMIEKDFGRNLAMEVARHLVLYTRRSSGQRQFSTQLRAQFPDASAMSQIQQYIVDNMRQDLRLKHLADKVAMSERNFIRLFKEATGNSVGDFITDTRLQYACELLVKTEKEMKVITATCGFGTEANMRKVFTNRLGMSPSQYRDSVRGKALEVKIDAVDGRLYDPFWLPRSEASKM